MSLKRYNVTLDETKAETLKKEGSLSSNLRLLMEKYSVSPLEGVKVRESEIDKISKRLESLESKLLKLDIEFMGAKLKFDTAYRRINKYLSSQGLSL